MSVFVKYLEQKRFCIMKEKYHNTLFICHSPFHVYISEKIVCQYFLKNRNYLCARKKSVKKNISSGVFKDFFFFGDCGGSILNKNKIETAYRSILNFVASKNIKLIFLCGINCALNNRIFFSNSLSMCTFEILSDGIGTYRTCKVAPFEFFKSHIKRLSYYFGISSKYTPYLGNVIGVDHKRVKSVYAFNCYQVPTKAQKKEISLIKKRCRAGGIVFLDQPIEHLCGEHLWNDYIHKVISYINERYGNERKFFKTHHRSNNKTKEIFKKAGYVVLDDEICIEQLNENYGFSVMMSCVSSSLLHCKWIFDETKTISLITKEILSKNVFGFNEILRIFKENEVVIDIIS